MPRPRPRQTRTASPPARKRNSAASTDWHRATASPPKLRGAFNQIAKKDDVKRLVTRRTRDVLDRALNSIASIYRDVAVLQNNAEDSVGLINLENRSSITELSVRLNRAGAVTRLDEVAHARKRLAGNGNPLLVFESLFCALIS